MKTTFTTFNLRGLDHKEDDQRDGPNDNQQSSSLKLHDPEIAEDEIALILSQGAAVNFKPLKFLQQAKDPAKANLSKNHQPSFIVTINTRPVSSIFLLSFAKQPNQDHLPTMHMSEAKKSQCLNAVRGHEDMKIKAKEGSLE